MLPSFIGFSFFLVVHVHAQTSYSSVPSTLWNALSSDKSGTYLTATSDYEGTFYSTDSGNTWASSIAGNFESIASNTNSGQYVIAASTSGTYVSSNFGASFEESTTTGGLQNCVSVSGTGEYMVSVSQFESTSQCLSYSSDFGLSFTKNLGPSAAVGECVAVALNDAGTTAVVSVSGSGLWMSSNPTSSTSWIQVYPSANTVYDVTYGGANFYAGLKSSPYSILLSSNNGNTWITRGSIGYSVSDIAVDSTGTKIVVAAAGMYYSDNSGLTFYTLDNTAIHSSTCAMNGAADNALWAGNSNVFHADPSVAVVPTVRPSASPTVAQTKPTASPTAPLTALPSKDQTARPSMPPTRAPTETPANWLTAQYYSDASCSTYAGEESFAMNACFASSGRYFLINTYTVIPGGFNVSTSYYTDSACSVHSFTYAELASSTCARTGVVYAVAKVSDALPTAFPSTGTYSKLYATSSYCATPNGINPISTLFFVYNSGVCLPAMEGNFVEADSNGDFRIGTATDCMSQPPTAGKNQCSSAYTTIFQYYGYISYAQYTPAVRSGGGSNSALSTTNTIVVSVIVSAVAVAAVFAYFYFFHCAAKANPLLRPSIQELPNV